eukprot:jgi/Mesvir1/19512/Mv16609-RA.2
MPLACASWLIAGWPLANCLSAGWPPGWLVVHLAGGCCLQLNKLLPASALVLHEKTWNAYPRLRTTITTPLFQHLRIEILSNHLPGDGHGVENALGLDESELAVRTVDFVDLAVDKVGKSDYRPELDPCLVSSKLTGRGPLAPGWQASSSPIMCAYKLVKVTADYWGVGPKVEKFVLSSMRELFLITHGNAVCMLDEWIGLTSDQIDELLGIAAHAVPVTDGMLAPPGIDGSPATEDISVAAELTMEPGAEEGGESGPGSSLTEETGFDLEEEDTVFYEADEVSWDSVAVLQGMDTAAAAVGNSRLRMAGSLSWIAESAPAPESEPPPSECGVCQSEGQSVRAALYCVNCAESFCLTCEAKVSWCTIARCIPCRMRREPWDIMVDKTMGCTAHSMLFQLYGPPHL